MLKNILAFFLATILALGCVVAAVAVRQRRDARPFFLKYRCKRLLTRHRRRVLILMVHYISVLTLRQQEISLGKQTHAERYPSHPVMCEMAWVWTISESS